MQRLLDAIERPRDRALVMLLYGSGLRISEALSLTTADVDSGRGVLTIRHTKGRRDRIVPLPAVTLEALREWMRQRLHRSEGLFPGRKGRASLTREAVHKLLRLAAARAGLTKRVYPHLLGHQRQGPSALVAGEETLALRCAGSPAAHRAVGAQLPGGTVHAAHRFLLDV